MIRILGGVLLLSISAFVSSCDKYIEVDEAYFCDNWRENRCIDEPDKTRTYSFEVPDSRAGTWFDLAYYMYFHSRQTPGIRVEFNRRPTQDELDQIRGNIRCSYRMRKGEKFAEGEMEGLRLDENGRGFWCFDYLGTMLVNFHKKYGSINELPSGDFFPVFVELHYKTGISGIEGGLESNISVKWTEISDLQPRISSETK